MMLAEFKLHLLFIALSLPRFQNSAERLFAHRLRHKTWQMETQLNHYEISTHHSISVASACLMLRRNFPLQILLIKIIWATKVAGTHAQGVSERHGWRGN